MNIGQKFSHIVDTALSAATAVPKDKEPVIIKSEATGRPVGLVFGDGITALKDLPRFASQQALDQGYVPLSADGDVWMTFNAPWSTFGINFDNAYYEMSENGFKYWAWGDTVQMGKKYSSETSQYGWNSMQATHFLSAIETVRDEPTNGLISHESVYVGPVATELGNGVRFAFSSLSPGAVGDPGPVTATDTETYTMHKNGLYKGDPTAPFGLSPVKIASAEQAARWDDTYTKAEADALFLKVTGEMIAGATPIVLSDASVQWGLVTAELYSHSALRTLALEGKLIPGKYYSYAYWAVYRQPVTNLTIEKTSTPELMLLQAATATTFSGSAISDAFPTDKIQLDVMDVSWGAVGVIRSREDVQGFYSNDDWRNITYRRYMTNGLHYHDTTSKGDNTGYDVTIVYGTVDATPTRYREYYVRFNTLNNPANPVITITKGGSSVTRELVKTDGTSFTANSFSATFTESLALIYYSVELNKYVAATSKFENDFAKNKYLSWNTSDFTIGNGTRQMVESAFSTEVYMFNSRTPVGRNVRVDSSPLSNVYIKVTGALNNVYIGPSTTNVSIEANALQNFRADSGFSNNLITCATLNTSYFPALSTSNLIYSARDLVLVAAPGVIQGTPVMKDSTLISTVSGGFSIAFSSFWSSTIRVLSGAFNLTVHRFSDSFWNSMTVASAGNDYVNMTTCGAKAFEYGSNRQGYNMVGRDGPAAWETRSYRTVEQYITEVVDLKIKTPSAGDSTMKALVRDTVTGMVREVNQTDMNLYYTQAAANALLANKVDKVAGKGLSTLDYSAADKVVVDSAAATLPTLTAGLQTKIDGSTAGILIDAGQALISVGSKGYRELPFTGKITGWTLIAPESGNVSITIKKGAFNNMPAATDLLTVALSAQSARRATGLNIAFTEGDVLDFVVNSSNLSKCQLFLQLKKD